MTEASHPGGDLRSSGARDLVILLVACAVAGAWIACSPVHLWHHADSLIPALVSLSHWTPFYWGQDRFGMLVPLLAAPVRHPFVNLLVQVGMAVATLAAPPVRFAYLVELPFGLDRKGWASRRGANRRGPWGGRPWPGRCGLPWRPGTRPRPSSPGTAWPP